MRPVQYSFPAPVYNGIGATQSWTTPTGAYVVLNGALSQQVQGTVDPASRYVQLPGIQRTIGIFSTGNLSGVVFYASGLDTNGRVVTASFIGPSGGSSSATDAFATFTSAIAQFEFSVVNYIYATSIASSAFTVGTGATGSTRWFQTDTFVTPFNVTAAVLTATAAAITIQDTPNDPNVSTAPAVFSHATLVGVVANQESNYAFPVRNVRGIVTTNSATGAGSTVSLQQAG